MNDKITKYFATEIKDEKGKVLHWTFKKMNGKSVMKFDNLNLLLRFFDNLKKEYLMLWIYQNGQYVRTIKKKDKKIYDKYVGGEVVVRNSLFEEEVKEVKKEETKKVNSCCNTKKDVSKIKIFYLSLLILTSLVLLFLIAILILIVFYNF